MIVGAVVLVVVVVTAVSVWSSSSSDTHHATTSPGTTAPTTSATQPAPAPVRPKPPPAPSLSLVATGNPGKFGESVGARGGGLEAAAATTWLPTSVVVQTWQRSGNGAWSAPSPLLPSGFHRSYDPSSATMPDGTVLISAGADLGVRPVCNDGGSVAIVRITSSGPSAPAFADNQRTNSTFDDRPTVAAGIGSDVWAGWSQGTHAASCDLVGRDDQVQVALSTDGGRTFGPHIAIPAAGGNFGVQIAPVGSGTAWVAWGQTFTGTTTARILLAKVANGRVVQRPTVVATTTALPSYLPGENPSADFPTFTLPTMITIGSRPALAWPEWVHGRSRLALAFPSSSGTGWIRTVILPPRGEDLILPALAPQQDGTALLVNAVYRPTDDAVGYVARTIAIDTTSDSLAVSTGRPVGAFRSGPGYHELGESLQLSTNGSAITGALTFGGTGNSRLNSVVWGG